MSRLVVRSLALILVSVALGSCSRKEPPSEVPVEVGSTKPGTCSTSYDPATAEPFPDGFNYPMTPESLHQAIGDSNKETLRGHGWYLFAGLNTPGGNGQPIWRTWPNSTPAFAAASPVADLAAPQSRDARSLIQANSDNTPVNLPSRPIYPVPKRVCETYGYDPCPKKPSQPGDSPRDAYVVVPDGSVFQNNGDIMIANVTYSVSAYEHIRKYGLYDGATLDGYQQSPGTIPEFPASSFVLKHMFWPVAAKGYTALPVWNYTSTPTTSDYLGYEKWTHGVAVRGAHETSTDTTRTVSFLHKVLTAQETPWPEVTYTDAEVFDLSAFYFQTFEQSDIDGLCINDRAILDQSAIWTYGRPFAAGDSIVSLAMHINTKEVPEWVFNTYWWSDKPESTGSRPDWASWRPDIPVSDSPGPWRNYLMMIEYGVPHDGATATDPEIWGAHYNPYIELVSHPVATNCRNCHLRGAWPSAATKRAPHSAYQVEPISDDPGLLTVIESNNAIFDGLMLLDYQWAVPDRASVPK